MEEVRFLTIDEILELHKTQIEEKGGLSGVKSESGLESSVAQPSHTFMGEYLYSDLFEMAAAYLISFNKNHSFHDGNKRVSAHSAINFLYLNGYEIEEVYEGEIADMIYSYLNGEFDEKDIPDFFADRAISLEE